MQELLQTLYSELKGWWRYRWYALGIAWLVSLAGWAGVYLYPDSYRSEARVYVDTSSALRPLLEKMTVNVSVLSRIEMVTTVMLGRPQLEKVARDTDLHLRATSQDQLDGIVTGLRQRIQILNDRRGEPNLYTIRYTDREPRMAQSVVSTLLNNFVEDSLGENRDDTEKAQEFLRGQLRILGDQLTASEKNLADFKRRNVGRMPGASGGYFSRLQEQMEALEQTQAEIRQAERRQESLRKQLAGETPSLDQSGGLQSDLDRRIEERETRLAELQLRYTDLHPDVIALKETLEQLRAQKQAELEALMESGGAGIVSDNPVFQNIQIELTNVSVEIAALREREREQLRKIDELRGLIDILPQIEVELTKLTRDYNAKEKQYQSLLQRLQVAELSESAEQSEDVEFRIIEPPVLPKGPAAPNRPIMISLVLLTGLGAAAGLAFLLNQLYPVFSSARALRDATGLPVLGSVQIMRTTERKHWRATQVTAFAGGLLVLVIVFGFVLLKHEAGSQILQSLV